MVTRFHFPFLIMYTSLLIHVRCTRIPSAGPPPHLVLVGMAHTTTSTLSTAFLKSVFNVDIPNRGLTYAYTTRSILDNRFQNLVTPVNTPNQSHTLNLT